MKQRSYQRKENNFDKLSFRSKCKNVAQGSGQDRNRYLTTPHFTKVGERYRHGVEESNKIISPLIINLSVYHVLILNPENLSEKFSMDHSVYNASYEKCMILP